MRAVRLVAVLLLAFLPALVLTLYLAAEERRRAVAEVEERALYFLRRATDEQERLIEISGRTLEVLSRFPAVRETDVEVCRRLLAEVCGQMPCCANMGLLDAAGNLLVSAVPADRPVNAADRLYFQRALATGRLAVGEFAVSRTTGRPVLHLGQPVKDASGQIKGVLWAALDLAWINRLCAESPLPPGAVLTVVDHRGLVLARWPNGEKWVGQEAPGLPLEEALAAGGEGVSWQGDAQRPPALYAFCRLAAGAKGGGVFAFLEVPAAHVYGEANRLLARSLAVTALSAFLMLAMVLLAGGGAFLLKRAERRARRSEERYRAIFENTGTATVIVEEDSTISLANEEFARLAGYAREEIEGKMSWRDFVAAAEDLRRMEEYHILRRTDPALAPRNYEARFRDRQGNVRDVYLTVAVIPGTKQSVASFLDITERKRAEEALLRKLRLEEAVASISARFLQAEDFDRAVNESLAEMGRLSNADRAYLFLFREKGTVMDNTHEWCAPGVSPQRENLQNLPGEAFPWWVARLRQKEVIHIADVSALPPEAAAEKEILKAQDIKSLLVLPVFAGGDLAGFLGFDNVRHAGSWREEDLLLLRLAADVFGWALERKQAYERLLELAQENARLFAEAGRRLRHLRALRSIDMAITASLDLRLTFEVILDQVVNRLGVDAAAILLFNPGLQALQFAAGRGFYTREIEEISLRLGEGLAGRAALSGETVSVPDLLAAAQGCPRARAIAAERFISYFAVPLLARGQLKGVLEAFCRAPREPDREWYEFMEAVARQAAVAIDNAAMLEDLRRTGAELALAYDATIEALARALDLRDRETEGHSRRVTEMTVELARALGVGEAELVHIRRGALLHDIGKLGVPDSILQKPGPLTAEEWEVMRRHPVYAYEMLSSIEHLRPALDIPYCHHEKYDGTGYPRGLKGEEIPLAARIFAVVDVFDALCSERPYRPAWPREKALEYIRREAGRHFDPRVVEAFLALMREKEGACFSGGGSRGS
ncbi:HD domain-containing phosphohydrolase [Desulfovirgula thermocuniculi]|uniref:HD domain-containing phosphohydrolase n=1 Tax=Desulfovirgula thermocuniculi TaxID=348842 RepID=UPI0004203ED4|nr:HD domain-containing phosphohydrolase [Desulfovirgula thermocuniculi]